MERRSAIRYRTRAAVECTTTGGAPLAHAFTYDLSTDGCMLELPAALLESGDRLLLDFGRRIAIEGDVAWNRHCNAGIRFASPLSSDKVDRIVRSSLLAELQQAMQVHVSDKHGAATSTLLAHVRAWLAADHPTRGRLRIPG